VLHRYGSIDYVLGLPIKQAIKLITYAKDQEDKEYLFRHYLMIYPSMDKKTYISFDKYYDDAIRPQAKLDTREMDDIMSEIMGIQVKEG